VLRPGAAPASALPGDTGDEERYRRRARQHHRHHHYRPHREDDKPVGGRPFRQHNHLLAAAHVHHLDPDARAEQQIGPCEQDHDGQAAEHDSAVAAQDA
jgi:hypothetical protein